MTRCRSKIDRIEDEPIGESQRLRGGNDSCTIHGAYRCGGWVTNDHCVRVGSSLQSGKTAGDDQSAGQEASKGSNSVIRRGIVGSRPEHDGAQAVQAQAHEDSGFVAFALHDLGGNG